MPNNEAGAFLNITPDVLKKLDSFDEKLEKIEKHSHTVAGALTNGFSSINLTASTLSTTIAALAKQINKLNMAGIAVRNVGEAMDSTTQSAQKTATATASITQSLSGMAQMANQLSTSQPFKNWDVEKLRTTQSALLKEMEAVREKYMRISNTNKPLIASISGESKNEIEKLYAQIQPLAKLIGIISAKQLPNAQSQIKPYLDEIQRIKAEIQRISSTSNSLTSPLRKELAAAKKEYETLFNYIQTINAKIVDSISQNDLATQQSKRLNELKKQLQEVEAEFAKLKGNGQAYNTDGSLSTQSRQLAAKKKSIEEEIRLQGQSLQQALDVENKKAQRAEKAREKEAKAAEIAAQRAEKAREKEAKAAEIAAQRAEKARADLAKRQNYQKNTTVQGALDFSKTAHTLQRQITAIEYLKKARLSLNISTKDGEKKLNELNQAIARHNLILQQASIRSQQLVRNQHNLWDIQGQLKRQIALLFSVTQIEGYIGKIAEVRGQFELQQVALRAILQNKDKADRIFSQTINQALKSSFQAMQLVTFTKQLAAYRIESDKLFDTTKRLADVSAGLGVDMQRLILAYGQVKAAAYLRGTEVRQFTEAGINLYGELRSYFEEVKGEAYTTAQIVDMISKRMVKFEDVEAVFQRMTDEGGIFYNMQEVQVNTLYGQINRLKDVISVMQNEIGKSTQEGFFSITSAISLVNKLIENWRTVASVLKVVLGSYAAFKGASALMWTVENISMAKNNAQKIKSITFEKIWNSLKWENVKATRAQARATTAATTSQRGLNAAVASNPYGAILSVIVAVGVAIYEVIRNTNRLEEELNNMAMEGAFNVVQSANEYVNLASIVADSTKSYQEHNKALAELKKKYSDILPEQFLTAKGIKELNNNYEEAIRLIHLYINAKTKERMIDEVGRDAYKEMDANQRETAKAISKIIKEQHGIKVGWDAIYGRLNQVQEKLLSGAITSTKQLREETEKVVEQYTGLGNINLRDYFTVLSGNSFGGANKFRFEKVYTEHSEIEDWLESSRTYISRLKSIEQRYSNDFLSMTEQRYQEQKDAAEKMIANAMNAFDVLRESQKENTKVTKDELEHARRLVQKVLKAIGSDVQVDSAYMNKLFNDSFFFEEEKRKATQAKYKQLFDELTKEAKETGDTSGAVWLQKFEKQINDMNLSPLQKSIKRFLLDFKGNEDIQANWNLQSEETEAELKKRIKTEIDTRNEIIRRSKEDLYPEYGQDTTKVETELRELNSLYNALGGADEKNGGSSAERDIWAERISVLKEMQSRYEKLSQFMGDTRAIEETVSAFNGALDFTQMGAILDVKDIIPTKQGMIEALEKLLNQIPNDVKNASKKTNLEKEIAELKIGIQQDYLNKQLDKTKKNIEDMFNGLDLHQKLKEVGLNEMEVQALFPGLAKTLDEVEIGIHAEYNSQRDKDGALGEKQQAAYDEALRKLSEQRIKEQQNLVLELTKNYKTQLSDQLQLDMWYYTERSKIYTQAYDEQTKSFKSLLTPEMQEQYEKNLRTEYDKQSSENVWKEFKGTDTYLNMFDNLEHVSTKAIESMKAKLETLREQMKNLDPAQLKEVMNFFNKTNEQLSKRTPFASFNQNITKIKGYSAQGISEEFLIQNNTDKDLENIALQQEMEILNRIIYLQYESQSITEEDAKFLAENIKWRDLEKTQLQSIIKQKQQIIDKNKVDIADNNEKLRTYKQTREDLQNLEKELSQIGQMGKDALGAISDLLVSCGQESDSLSVMFMDMGSTILDMVLQTIMFQAQLKAATLAAEALGYAMNTAMGVLGWIVMAIQLIAKLITSIVNIKDKQLQQRIEEHQGKIETLQKSYEKLKEAMDKAWSISSLEEYNNALNKNIDYQIAQQNAIVAAQKQRKKPDENAIKEAEAMIEDLKEKRKEVADDTLSELGGIPEAEYKSAAQSFVDAWMDAYMETGDGLDVLQDKFEDFFTNVLKKQAMMKVAEKFLKPIFTELENALSDYDLSKDEADKLRAIFDETAPEFNEALKSLMESLGIMGGQGKAELSALTQSIQGITESTAEALESLLNSIRFFVAQQTTDISAIRGLLTAQKELESRNSENNPMLVELQEQTGYLQELRDCIKSVLTTSANIKGAGLRVYLQN